MKSLVFLALVAYSVLAQKKYPLANPSGLRLSPPFLTMLDDSVYGAPITVSLRNKPKGKVVVYFDAPNFSASRCRLDFSPKNWNKGQIVRISPLPYLTPSDAKRVVEGTFLTVGATEKFHKKRQKFQIVRTGGAGASCTAGGDPHYKNFGGRTFDFQGIGAYYMVKTPLLTIQQFNQPFGNSPVTGEARIAIRYHKTVYVFEGSTGACNLASDTNENMEIHNTPGVSWRVVLSDGSVISMTRHPSAALNFINIDIAVGTMYKGKTAGICGMYNVPVNNNLMIPGGGVVGDGNTLGNSWKVPDNDNLFTLGDKAACITAPEDPQGGNGGAEICALPPPEELDGNGEEDLGKGDAVLKDVKRLDLAKEAKTLKAELAKPIVPPKAAADKWAQEARLKCKTTLTIQEANNIMDPKIYIDDCTDDCVLSGSYDFVDDSKDRYLAAVRRLTKSVLNEPAIRDGVNKVADDLKAKAKDVAEKAGLGGTECPKNCSEQGTCTVNGCKCNEGFTGLDCSEALPDKPDAKAAFVDGKAPVARPVGNAPQPKIIGEVKQAEKLEAANMAKKLAEAKKP